MEEELFNIKSRFGEYPSYRVTKSGKVYSYRQGNMLKPLSIVLDSSGYPIVKLYDNTNKVRTIAVHRLIADTFIPNPDNLECINHRESNPNKKVVNQIDGNGNIINTYLSIREAARQLGNIRKDSNICTGIRTHQKRYGYYWEYASV